MSADTLKLAALRYGGAVSAVLVTAFTMRLLSERINPITVALAFLVIVLSMATFLGRNPALLASFAAMLCFNYYFLPPVGTWHIAESQNLIAWAAFTLTAIIAGELSAYAQRRSRESERLYAELQAVFEQATKAEALKQSEKLKSSLLDAVTHDLRTPLTSIKAAVTTLLESEGGHRTIELDAEGRLEFLNVINEETDRLNRFIEGMVELAKIEGGSAIAERSMASVEEVVAIALARAEKMIGDHEVEVDIAPDLPLIRSDARALGEVVYNLIENAVKYSPSRSKISISGKQNEDQVEIIVNDEGRGIPVEMRERVFEKFVRIGDGNAAGMGIGLSIARGIVEAQNGTIAIETGAGGRGTRIIVSLPIGES